MRRKLPVGAVHDPLESEADAAADYVIREPLSARIHGESGAVLGKPPTQNSSVAALPLLSQVLQSTGQPMDAATRSFMEPRFGHDLSHVRIHNDRRSQESARDLNAMAYAVGNDVVFGAGHFKPGTAEGNRLIAHELAHVLQAGARDPSVIRRQPDTQKGPRVVGEGWIIVGSRRGPAPPFPDKEQMRLLLKAWSHDFTIDLDVIDECGIQLVGVPGAIGARFRFTHPDLGRVLDFIYTGASRNSLAFEIEFYWVPPQGTSGKENAGGAPSGRTRPTGTDPQGRPLKAPRELLSPDPKSPAKDPEEAIRLYELIREHLAVETGEEGEEIVKFARFLEKNKGKIEGVLRLGKTGMTEADIQKIIDMYGKFIAAERSETPDKLETADDFNNVFKYDPNWQRMSKEDRQLLIDYSKMRPEEIETSKLDFSRLSQSMKEEMALKLVDSWPAEVAEAAENAFTDPGFFVSLVLTIAIYIGLWLTPDPTLVTKIAAGTLTAVMWAMFAWEDIWKTMIEYSAFEENVRRARTAAELKAAANRLAKKIGAVGFDILMMIATWGLGKAAGPKLRAIGARRGVVRAEAGFRAAAADPAAGVPKTATGTAKTLLSTAESNARGTTATAVLDALEPSLDGAAKEGLSAMRDKAGDMNTYHALKGQTAKGLDIGHFLAEKAATPEAKALAQAKLLTAEAKVARAKLIETETIADPTLRKAARTAQMNDLVQRFKTRLNEMGLLNDAKVKQAVQDHNLKDLTGALGEAMARQQLKAGLPNLGKARIVSNLAVLKEVPGYRTIADWQKATGASTRDAAKMFQGQGKIYESLGEIDSMVVEEIPNGKPRATLIEEVKTGATDGPQKALQQVTQKVIPALQKIAAGDKGLKLFELIGKKALGSERTDAFDFSGDIRAQTRGPSGKGFQESLGYDPEVLEATAESLIKDGLPPAAPQTIPPLTGLRPKREETRQLGSGAE
jgi:hypothetical protein